MDYLTRYYMRLYSDYLNDIENGVKPNDICHFDSITDHTFAFLLSQNIDEENAWRIIDDFKDASHF